MLTRIAIENSKNLAFKAIFILMLLCQTQLGVVIPKEKKESKGHEYSFGYALIIFTKRTKGW